METIDGADPDGGSGGDGGGVVHPGLPEFASDLNLAGGSERSADDGNAADHGLRAGEDFVAAGAERDPGEAEGDAAEGESGGDGEREVDAQLGDRAVDQGGESKDERADAGGGEDAVAGELRLQRDQEECGDQQQDGGVADRQQVQPEDASRTSRVPSAPGTMVPGTLNSR